MAPKDLERLTNLCSSIQAEIEALGEVVHKWGEPLRVFDIVRRACSSFLGRAGVDAPQLYKSLVRILEVAVVMSQPPIVQNVLADEVRGRLALTGAQLQLLNNVSTFGPWEFSVFSCNNRLGNGVYVAREMLSGREICVCSSELDGLRQADKSLASAVLIPVDLQVREGLPSYAAVSPVLGFNTFSPDDMDQILRRLFEIPLHQRVDAVQSRELLLSAAPPVSVLSLFGSRNEYLTSSEVQALLCIGKKQLPADAIDGALAFLDKLFAVSRVADVVYMEAVLETDGPEEDGGEVIQLFIDTASGGVDIRTTGADAWAVATSLVDLAAAGGAKVSGDLPEGFIGRHLLANLGIDVTAAAGGEVPDFCMGLIAALAARDIVNQELPGPGRRLLEQFDLDW